MTVIVVGVVVLVGGVIFAVGGGGGDRRASIGESAKTADKAAPERPAGKPIEIPAGQARADQANQVVEALGPQRSAGAYFDSETDAMIVTVVDDAAGAAVRSEGGRPKLVNNSAAKLAATEKALKPDVQIAGVAYGVDVANNKILVTVDGSVSHADRNKIKAAIQTAALVSRGPATTLHPSDCSRACRNRTTRQRGRWHGSSTAGACGATASPCCAASTSG